ncbi:uncharacterized protein LOC133318213 [Gastrolobium bilobum]|uniref:uncharacterized protein LOC133318213 n=1 Tax=Gastrolobium bilobum TaxID=150636 RepID=UPI002AB2B3EC|nr:uncharacterized protein LOC133318213 [Gastrolobium bilobum]
MSGIQSYFKRQKSTNTEPESYEPHRQNVSIVENSPQSQRQSVPPQASQFQSFQSPPEAKINIENLEADPGKRPSLYSMTSNPIEREDIRRAYLLKGPTQPILKQFPQTEMFGKMRRFNSKWYEEFGSWLEYSVSRDACFCLYCYLFDMEVRGSGSAKEAFVGVGFKNWQKKDRIKVHVGDHRSVHNRSYQAGQDLMKQNQHIDIAFSNISEQQRIDYRIRLKASLDCARYLLRNGQPFRGHDESESSNKQGLFLETLKFYTKPNKEMSHVVLQNAPDNHKMTSPKIQKDLAQACADLTVKAIITDLGNDYFSLLVDEARDVAIKEQMAVVLRYVNRKGSIVECFIGIIHVSDTTAKSLKAAIDLLFSKLGLSLSKCRGQGYDGASNMRGEFKGLKSLILAENKSALYIHCFAHQLQLALVKVAKHHKKIQEFFDMLQKMATVVGGSCKRKEILQMNQYEHIVERIARGEIPTGKSLNQETTIKRPGDTRWGSHFGTVTSVISLFSPIISLMKIIEDEPRNDAARTDAGCILYAMEDYEFAFLLHLMQLILGISYELSQALQRKDQDLLNAIGLVKVVKSRLQEVRDNGFDELLQETNIFANKYDIDIPNMEDVYYPKGRSRRRLESFTFLHYFKVELFNTVIDTQVQELGDRFDNVNTKLLECLSCLDPRDSFASFNKEKLIEFARFYPLEFNELADIPFLSSSLGNFIVDVRADSDFVNLERISDLALKMVEKRKDIVYPLVYLLIKLALVLPVATASVERVFSAMTFVKDKLRNRISDDWFNACMLTYVERDMFDNIDDEDIMQYFQRMKNRRMLLSSSTANVL